MVVTCHEWLIVDLFEYSELQISLEDSNFHSNIDKARFRVERQNVRDTMFYSLKLHTPTQRAPTTRMEGNDTQAMVSLRRN